MDVQVRFEVGGHGSAYTLQQMPEGNLTTRPCASGCSLRARVTGSMAGCRCAPHAEPDRDLSLAARQPRLAIRVLRRPARVAPRPLRAVALLTLQQKHDTDWTILNSVAPPAFRIEDVPLWSAVIYNRKRQKVGRAGVRRGPRVERLPSGRSGATSRAASLRRLLLRRQGTVSASTTATRWGCAPAAATDDVGVLDAVCRPEVL